MRKSLYRAKRIDNGEWIYGDLLTPTDIMAVWEISENTGMGDRHEVDPDTIGQYTGRADKNGKMIFEGDYLGEHCSNDCGTWLSKYGVVTWWESDARYVLTDKEGIANDLTYEEAVAALHWDDLEVIGNIHDSPDLPELAETDSCVLFVSYSGAVVGKIQLVTMLYARDESSAEYRLYVADDYLAEGREVQEYRYIVRSDTAGMPAGQWLRIEDGKATPQYPAEYPLYFEQKGSQAPLTAVAEKIFN